MPLRADDMEPPDLDYVVIGLAIEFYCGARIGGHELGEVDPLLLEPADGTGLGHPRPEFDIGPTARHIRRDRDSARLSRVCYDLGLLLVVLRVEDVVLDTPSFEHPREGLGDIYGDGPDEDG